MNVVVSLLLFIFAATSEHQTQTHQRWSILTLYDGVKGINFTFSVIPPFSSMLNKSFSLSFVCSWIRVPHFVNCHLYKVKNIVICCVINEKFCWTWLFWCRNEKCQGSMWVVNEVVFLKVNQYGVSFLIFILRSCSLC